MKSVILLLSIFAIFYCNQIGAQGFTKEVHDGKTYHYPILSLICDIRKMQEIYNIIQDEKVIVDKLINKK